MVSASSSDPTIIAGIIGLLGALLGAIIGGAIGGAATIFAAFQQHRVENRDKMASALTSVLSELLTHQPTLYLNLDKCLPLWLSRMHLDDTKKRRLEIELKNVCVLSIYDTRMFDERFSDIMTSRYGEKYSILLHQDSILKQYVERVWGLSP